MKRTVTFIFAVALAGCTAVDPPPQDVKPNEMTWRILASGEYGSAATEGEPPPQKDPILAVARTQDEYRELWAEHIGEKEPPPAEFTEESVVFLLSGSQPSGGYSIDPRDVHRVGEELQVQAELKQPAGSRRPDRTFTTTAITAPYVVVAVNDREFSQISWYQQGERVASEPLHRIQK